MYELWVNTVSEIQSVLWCILNAVFLQSVLSVCVDKIHWLCVECWQRFIRFIYTAFLRRIFIGANSPRGGTEETICQKSKPEQNKNNGLSVVNIVQLEMILQLL